MDVVIMNVRPLDPTEVPRNAVIVGICLVAATAFYQYKRYQRTQELCRSILSVVLTGYCLHVGSVILFDWPPNLFTFLELSPTAPVEVVREALFRKAALPADATLAASLERLLVRLSSFDTRAYYVRFGQMAIQHCAWCESFHDYVIYALSRSCPAYIVQAVLLCLLTTSGSGRERWRKPALFVEGVIAAIECFFITSAEIKIPEDASKAVMWHDVAWFTRQVLLLLLPIATHCAPRRPPLPSPALSLAAARDALNNDLRRFTSLRFIHGAILRDPALRAASIEWWEQQREEGEWAREDENVIRVAEKLGKGFSVETKVDGEVVEGRLGQVAKAVVSGVMRDGLAPAPS